MGKTITFIHAADLHLDSPMLGLRHLPEKLLEKMRESTFQALRKITALALQHKVDFVIFAGDLYDGEDRSLRAQSIFRTEMSKLAAEGIPVFVVHGNHDHLNGSWVNLDLPENVQVFSEDVETKEFKAANGTIIHLYGFSYPTRHVIERKIDGYTRKEGADFHIGILHGHDEGSSEHGKYAPFSVKELLEKQFDYWALGHIHKRAILSEDPPIIFPGNIQGRNRKETGEKGVYLVQLSEDGADCQFHKTSVAVWEEAIVDAHGARSFHDILGLCQQVMDTYREQHSGTILTIVLKNMRLNDDKNTASVYNELLEILQEDEGENENFVWIIDVRVEEPLISNREQLIGKAEFYKELFLTIDEYEQVEDTLAPLYHHQQARKHLNSLQENDQQLLLEKAESLLLTLIAHQK